MMNFICKDIFADVANDCRAYQLDNFIAFQARVREQFGEAPHIPAEQYGQFNAGLEAIANMLDFHAGKDVKLPDGDAEFYKERWKKSNAERIAINDITLLLIPHDDQDNVRLAEIGYMQEAINIASSLSFYRQRTDRPAMPAPQIQDYLESMCHQNIDDFDTIARTYSAGGGVMAFNHAFDQLTQRVGQQRPVLGRLISMGHTL